jgi:hypothetical protein
MRLVADPLQLLRQIERGRPPILGAFFEAPSDEPVEKWRGLGTMLQDGRRGPGEDRGNHARVGVCIEGPTAGDHFEQDATEH